MATGEQYAVKRLSSFHDEHFPYLVDNEMRGLIRAHAYNIPRVVKYVEFFGLSAGGVYLILE